MISHHHRKWDPRFRKERRDCFPPFFGRLYDDVTRQHSQIRSFLFQNMPDQPGGIGTFFKGVVFPVDIGKLGNFKLSFVIEAQCERIRLVNGRRPLKHASCSQKQRHAQDRPQNEQDGI